MSAPAFFHVESPYVSRNLREKIEARRVELTAQLADGLVSSQEDYKYRYGVLTGLKEALSLLDEIEKNERN